MTFSWWSHPKSILAATIALAAPVALLAAVLHNRDSSVQDAWEARLTTAGLTLTHSDGPHAHCCELPVAAEISPESQESSDAGEPLKLTGYLMLDYDRRVEVRSRLPGEVVTIGSFSLTEERPIAQATASNRTYRVGDFVEKDELIAVVWSKDLGEKKSDLLKALSQLNLDKAELDRLHGLNKGEVAQRSIFEAQRSYEADVVEVQKIERTLTAWRLGEADIEAVRAEAERLHRGEKADNKSAARGWAEVDIRAPFSGVIVERNVAVGDIVDSQLNLFTIADLSRLRVLANVYEQDLPKVLALPPEKRVWHIRVKASPALPPVLSTFDSIGNVVDPLQHTAAIMGWVENPGGRLRVGQFITATIDMPGSQQPSKVTPPKFVDAN